MPEGGYDLVFQDKRFLLVGRVRRRASVGVAMIRTTATAAACLVPIPLDLRRSNRMTSRTPAVAYSPQLAGLNVGITLRNRAGQCSGETDVA
jgi:hypothetical protein